MIILLFSQSFVIRNYYYIDSYIVYYCNVSHDAAGAGAGAAAASKMKNSSRFCHTHTHTHTTGNIAKTQRQQQRQGEIKSELV
jgi:hypothetical protein